MIFYNKNKMKISCVFPHSAYRALNPPLTSYLLNSYKTNSDGSVFYA